MDPLLKMMHADYEQIKEDAGSTPASSDDLRKEEQATSLADNQYAPNRRQKADSFHEEIPTALKPRQPNTVPELFSSSTEKRAPEGDDIPGVHSRRSSTTGDANLAPMATSYSKLPGGVNEGARSEKEAGRGKASASFDGTNEIEPSGATNGKASNRQGENGITNTTAEEVAKLAYGTQSFGV